MATPPPCAEHHEIPHASGKETPADTVKRGAARMHRAQAAACLGDQSHVQDVGPLIRIARPLTSARMLQPGPDPRAVGGDSIQELRKAMHDIFSHFAGSAVRGESESPLGPGDARPLKGCSALGIADFLRVARAAKLRLSQTELQAAFRTTTRQSRGVVLERGAEPVLTFEHFVELLIEVARRRYCDLGDADGVALLFEEHLLPLALQLQKLHGGHELTAN